MLAKLTSKNQLTLPKAATEAVAQTHGLPEYFDVQVQDGRIVLTPVRIQRADAVRAKLAQLAIAPQDITDAVAWARALPQAAPAAHAVHDGDVAWPAGPTPSAPTPSASGEASRAARPTRRGGGRRTA